MNCLSRSKRHLALEVRIKKLLKSQMGKRQSKYSSNSRKASKHTSHTASIEDLFIEVILLLFLRILEKKLQDLNLLSGKRAKRG